MRHAKEASVTSFTLSLDQSKASSNRAHVPGCGQNTPLENRIPRSFWSVFSELSLSDIMKFHVILCVETYSIPNIIFLRFVALRCKNAISGGTSGRLRRISRASLSWVPVSLSQSESGFSASRALPPHLYSLGSCT